ncbi:alkaline phosphatase PhoX [Solwaraspora sp. WMMB335]|uniref:alkaline phosphatase PhoX n=1 Tax=Solwaraspora sp. WMMB335 TaxID=3404118 RepID=UPI003B9604F4
MATGYAAAATSPIRLSGHPDSSLRCRRWPSLACPGASGPESPAEGRGWPSPLPAAGGRPRRHSGPARGLQLRRGHPDRRHPARRRPGRDPGRARRHGRLRRRTRPVHHGYVFEVRADGHADPRPIRCLGRYAHEALAIDADRTKIYLSEDADGPNGLFYRWTAPRRVKLGPGVLTRLAPDAGVLAAMQIIMDDGSVLPDVAYLTSAQLGRPFPVRWIEVPERDAQTTTVREQFADDEVTRGRKFEGVWGTDQGVYVVNSYAWEDGDLPADAAPHDGMVWFYDYRAETIQLVTYFPHQTTSEEGTPAKYSDLTFDGPDNVTVTPWGSLVLAEDGSGASHVLSAIPGGPTYAIARNQLNDSEFCGPTFTDDGKILFVNMQDPGLTLAITGPWEKYLS